MSDAIARPAPAAHLVASDTPTRSWFGGDPELPSSLAWPAKDEEPLHFLLRLSLPELHAAQPLDWLPSRGALLFFYDIGDQPWGFDPADRGSWAILHVAEDGGPTTPLPETSEYDVQRRFVALRAIESLPSAARVFPPGMPYDEERFERHEAEVRAPFDGKPMHQVGGWPYPQQSDEMELESQLVSNGLYCGDASGYADPRYEQLAKGAAEWRLLFQMDSDDDLGVMWGDCGLVYFWIREQDARAGRFDGAWVILQCG